MVRQAEINKAADQRRKELIEARNQADQAAYVAEKSLRDLPEGRQTGTEDRRALEQLIAEVRRAAQGEDVTAIREALNRLQQAASRISSAGAGGTGGAAPRGRGERQRQRRPARRGRGSGRGRIPAGVAMGEWAYG